MDVICVDRNDLILELKVTVIVSPLVGGYGMIVIHRDDVTQGVNPTLSKSNAWTLTPSVLKL